MADTVVDKDVDSDPVWYSIADGGACVVLTVGGRIGSQNCPDVCEAVLAASWYSTGLVIDLRRAEFGQAEAAGVFVRSLQRSHQRASSVWVVGPPEPVEWLLGFSAKTAHVRICATLTEAVAMVC